MRRLAVALLSLVVAGAAAAVWLLLARAPEDGLLAWDGDGGELRVVEPGIELLPRWRWDRISREPLRTAVETRTRAGRPVSASVVWNPLPGSYRLVPAPEPAAAVSGTLAEVAGTLLSEVPLSCVATELGEDDACPEGWRERAAERLAAALGSAPDRLRVGFTAAPEGVREALLDSIRGRLPASGRRVFVLGVDAFDWDYVLPLVEAGRMPNLARLLEAGTWGTMQTLQPIVSPLIWTTVATGVSPDVHRILDFVEIDPESGRQVPVTGRGRRVPALWNIASALGRRADVVGWWATWPAERQEGTMVSDRLYYTLTQAIESEVLREDPPGMVSPAERTEEFARLRDRTVREVDWETVRELMEVERTVYREAVAAGRGMEDPVDGFRRILASTRTYLGAGLALAREGADLLMVYLEGTDTVGHLLARYLPPPVAPDVSAERAAVYAAAVPSYFEEVDRWIGRYLEALPPAEVSWIVVSDHGFTWGEDRPRESGSFDAMTAVRWHRGDAVFLLAGAGVDRLGRVAAEASVYDVAPTVTGLLGLPAGAGWEGEPLPGVEAPALEPLDYSRLLPARTYRSEVSAPAPVDPEFLDQLRALGYLGGEPEAAPGTVAAPAPEDAGVDIADDATRGELNNLGISYQSRGRVEEAERVFLEATRRFPDYPTPWFNLANLYLIQKRWDEAERYLWPAVERAPSEAADRLLQVAGAYREQGEPDRAVALLEESVRRFPGAEELWYQLLHDLGRLRRCAEGVAAGRRASEQHPQSPRILTLHGMAAACAGETAEARRLLERSLELQPEQPTARSVLRQLR